MRVTLWTTTAFHLDTPRSKSLTLDFLPMQERPSVKKLLAYEKK